MEERSYFCLLPFYFLLLVVPVAAERFLLTHRMGSARFVE